MRTWKNGHPERRGGPIARFLRGLVFIALLPALLVAGIILAPVIVIARLVGLGPACRGDCRGRFERPDATAGTV